MHNQSTFLKYPHIVLIAYFLYKGEKQAIWGIYNVYNKYIKLVLFLLIVILNQGKMTRIESTLLSWSSHQGTL